MDGRRLFSRPLTWIARLRARPPTSAARRSRARRHLVPPRVAFATQRFWGSILAIRVPRGVGLTAAAFLIVGGLVYGVIKGDHIPTIIETMRDARDQAANAAGFRIVSLALSGNQHVTREEVLAISGVTGRTSLLFLDVEVMREKLKANPWVAEATLLKLYPGELQIGIREREPFALWQRQGRVFVIADDGTVLEPYVAPRLLQLPLVVGSGAEAKAKEFMALVERYPAIREQVRASILIGERRWNLRLRNGLDVRLPEIEVAQALERLATLDREAKLITRDIVFIDLRLPDRVTVRLSPAAVQSRSDALKEKKPPAKKGGNA